MGAASQLNEILTFYFFAPPPLISIVNIQQKIRKNADFPQNFDQNWGDEKIIEMF